ncbi:MAG: hypothetical protein KatS3mg131_3008 [Candidatus Tectimicrobiota bacterium]|nr:MAG: hypothetical protein KatS3mg131_3008 [Candidatus Tectomicrobia bacterium]
MTFTDWLLSCEAALALRLRAVLRHGPPGAYRGREAGKGFRLHHYEAYRPGDDRRGLDWKASRKEGTLLVRRFTAERRLEVLALCDVSASMCFGRTQPKLRIALDCAGLLALAALRRGNAFGLLAFAADVVAYFPPRQRRDAVLAALEYLWTYRPEGTAAPTRLAAVLPYLSPQRPRLVCLLSDLRTPDWQEVLAALCAHHDPLVVRIADEGEKTLPTLGPFVVKDLESGEHRLLDTASLAVRRAYRQAAEAVQAEHERALQRLCGTAYVLAEPTTDYREALVRLFLEKTYDTAR